MSNETLKDIATELVQFLAEFKSSTDLRHKMDETSVFTQLSLREQHRTIELEVLETDGDQVYVAASSDGPMGSVGVDAVYFPEGMKLLSSPKLFIKGVPTEEIDISLNE